MIDMFIVKKKSIIKMIKETFSVTISEKEFDEKIYNSHPLKQYDNVERFMEETLDEIELDIVDIIHKNDKVEIVAERISRMEITNETEI